MLAIGFGELLALEKLKASNEPAPGITREDDVVYVTSFGGKKGIHKGFAVGSLFLQENSVGV